MIKLPAPVADAMQALAENGFEAYAVGGCVRDVLLGKEPFDWDVTTSAPPEDICRVFAHQQVIPTGLQHGTVTVLIDRVPIEITTYRVDGSYSDGRHPDDVRFTTYLSDDLRRRDFTVNAIAYSPLVGIVDLHGGKTDLKDKIIRCVGDPAERFTEDALRILRALRFAAVLGFSIDDATGGAIRALADRLSLVSAERITTELKKLLCGADVRRVLSSFSEVFAVILPELEYTAERYQEIADLFASAPPVLNVRLALLFSQAPNCANQALLRLRFEKNTVTTITTVLDHLRDDLCSDSALQRLIGVIGYENAYTLADVRYAMHYEELRSRIARMQAEGVCCRRADLAVNGNDLTAVGYSGRAVGTELQRLLDAVIDGKAKNEHSTLLELASHHYKQKEQA